MVGGKFWEDPSLRFEPFLLLPFLHACIHICSSFKILTISFFVDGNFGWGFFFLADSGHMNFFKRIAYRGKFARHVEQRLSA